MLDINKQPIKYSLQGQTFTIVEKDDEGNPKYYETEDGQKIYYTREVTGYSEPVDFKANIAFSGGEAEVKEYGFDTADFDAVMVTDRNALPIQKGDIIWLNSEPTYTEDDLIDDTSADFTVIGIKPALHSTKYMLKAVVK